MTAYNAKESKEQDSKRIIDLMNRIHARSSNNLNTPEDVDRLKEHLLKDATAILRDVEELMGHLCRIPDNRGGKE